MNFPTATIDENAAQSAHSPIGASSMKRWEACPGSVNFTRGLKNVSSVYAEEGTTAHELAQRILAMEGIEDGVYPDEMWEAVQVYVDHVRILWAEATGHQASFIKIEHRFDLSFLHPQLFGTADAVIYDGKTRTLFVQDYKHGAGIPVEVENNEQLLYYALGAILTLGVSPVKVVLGIIQPRCFHPDGPIRLWEIDAFDMLDFEDRLVKAAKRTEDKNAPLIPGPHCGFCPGKGICPALTKSAQALAKIEFADPLNYDPVKLSEVLSRIPELKAFIEGVHAFAYAEAQAGRPPPGWKLVQKRAFRKWRNEEAAQEMLARVFKLRQEDMFELSFRSVPQIEKLIPKDQKKLLADITIAESSGLTLAPESDKREAVKLDARSQFTMIEDGVESTD